MPLPPPGMLSRAMGAGRGNTRATCVDTDIARVRRNFALGRPEEMRPRACGRARAVLASTYGHTCRRAGRAASRASLGTGI